MGAKGTLGGSMRHSDCDRGFFSAFITAVWGAPRETCPKCKSAQTEYYDPFFFAPLRTLQGRRRIKCRECGFIWRPSRSGRSFLSGRHT